MDILTLNKAIKDSFLRVKQDLINVRLWFDYFRSKFSQNDREHAQIRAFLVEQQEFNHNILNTLKKLSSRVSNLDSEVSNIAKANKDVIKDNLQIKESISEIKLLHNNISELFKVVHDSLEKGHVRDISGTRQGHIRDMTHISKKSEMSRNVKSNDEVLPQRSKNYKQNILNTNELTTSQKYLLRILLNASKPLSYAELSRVTTRKEKTIRNLIYTLRKRGFDIRDEFTSPKEKVFFLPDPLKLVLTGR